MRAPRWLLGTTVMIGMVAFQAGCGGQPAAQTSPPPHHPTSSSATPCVTTQCELQNVHRQDLTFAGDLTGHATSASVVHCDVGSSFFEVDLFVTLASSQAILQMQIVGYHGPGRYDLNPQENSGPAGTITAFSNHIYGMSGGSINADDKGKSGTLTGDYALRGDPAKTIHVAGSWSCTTPSS